jgi:hypothetical protein
MRGGKQPGAGRKQFDGKNEEIVVQKLEQVWAVDGTDTEAAFFADISPAALCEYLKSHPKIAERKEALKNRPVLLARIAMIESFDGHDEECEETIKKDGKNVIVKVTRKSPKNPDMAFRYVSAKRKREFSTLQQHEVGEQGTFKELTDEQLAQIAAGKKTPADFLIEKKP